MDFWTVMAYAWAVFNSACAFVTAFCSLWLVRRVGGIAEFMNARENYKWRKASEDAKRIMGLAKAADGVESGSEPIAGEREGHESPSA